MNTATETFMPPGAEALVLRCADSAAPSAVLVVHDDEPQVVILPAHRGEPTPTKLRNSPPPWLRSRQPQMSPLAYRIYCRDVRKQMTRQRRFAGQSPDDRAAALAAAEAKRARKGRVS